MRVPLADKAFPSQSPSLSVEPKLLTFVSSLTCSYAPLLSTQLPLSISKWTADLSISRFPFPHWAAPLPIFCLLLPQLTILGMPHAARCSRPGGWGLCAALGLVIVANVGQWLVVFTSAAGPPGAACHSWLAPGMVVGQQLLAFPVTMQPCSPPLQP